MKSAHKKAVVGKVIVYAIDLENHKNKTIKPV